MCRRLDFIALKYAFKTFYVHRCFVEKNIEEEKIRCKCILFQRAFFGVIIPLKICKT